MYEQGGAKRQQSNGGAALEGDPVTSPVASVLGTAEQLAFPVAASSGAPAAQNLRAAVGAAQAEAEQQLPPAPACNNIAAGKHADDAVPASHQTAPAAQANTGDPRVPSERHEPDAVAGTSQSSPAGAALALSRAPEPDHGSVSMQLQPELAAPSGSSPGCGHDAEQSLSSADLGPDAGKRQLQGLPTPTGSHLRFDSDDDCELPRTAAAELEDSEVIAQLQFVADERGQLVISFDGRSIVEPQEPGQERAQTHAQAGSSRKRDTPTKPQRQWCAPSLLL